MKIKGFSQKRSFVAYFYLVGWDFNLGLHISWSQPNIEIHVPGGFFRIGFEKHYFESPENFVFSRLEHQDKYRYRYRAYGLAPKFSGKR